MRAITFIEKLRFEPDHPEPMPTEGECIVKVRLAGICSTDHEIVKGYMGFRGIPGHEMVGDVVKGSPEWVGKRVVAEINCVCKTCDMCQAGLSSHCRKRTVVGIAGRDGCFADLVAVPEHNLHEVPETIPDESAVFVEPIAAACQIIQQVSIDHRSNVVVVGSGRLGLLIAQVLAKTGCKLEVVGRNPKTLLFCEKKRIRSTSVESLIPRNDRDVVVECTGSPQGFDIALSLVRPRGTIVLKSTYADGTIPNPAAIVINEINVVGSRCGPFPDAINALARRDIDVSPMVARSFPIERGLEAFQASRQPENIKVLLKINPR